jgi:hypothetical protein
LPYCEQRKRRGESRSFANVKKISRFSRQNDVLYLFHVKQAALSGAESLRFTPIVACHGAARPVSQLWKLASDFRANWTGIGAKAGARQRFCFDFGPSRAQRGGPGKRFAPTRYAGRMITLVFTGVRA